MQCEGQALALRTGGRLRVARRGTGPRTTVGGGVLGDVARGPVPRELSLKQQILPTHRPRRFAAEGEIELEPRTAYIPQLKCQRVADLITER